MATAKKITQLTAVSTPAGTDTLAAEQGGTTKKLTVTQIISLAVAAALATISQSDAEAGTATDRRIFTAQRVKQAIDALASGGTAWEVVTGTDTIAAGEGFMVEGSSTFTVTLASTIAVGDVFIIHVTSDFTGVLSIEPNTGHTIQSPVGTDVAGGTDTITVAAGETIHLVAETAAILEII